MGNTRGANIGEFEELVLLVVGTLYDNAYGVEIRNFLMNETGRKVNISAVHEVLKRLEKKMSLIFWRKPGSSCHQTAIR